LLVLPAILFFFVADFSCYSQRYFWALFLARVDAAPRIFWYADVLPAIPQAAACVWLETFFSEGFSFGSASGRQLPWLCGFLPFTGSYPGQHLLSFSDIFSPFSAPAHRRPMNDYVSE
jgi:hypothetical protein